MRINTLLYGAAQCCQLKQLRKFNESRGNAYIILDLEWIVYDKYVLGTALQTSTFLRPTNQRMQEFAATI